MSIRVIPQPNTTPQTSVIPQPNTSNRLPRHVYEDFWLDLGMAAIKNPGCWVENEYPNHSGKAVWSAAGTINRTGGNTTLDVLGKFKAKSSGRMIRIMAIETASETVIDRPLKAQESEPVGRDDEALLNEIHGIVVRNARGMLTYQNEKRSVLLKLIEDQGEAIKELRGELGAAIELMVEATASLSKA